MGPIPSSDQPSVALVQAGSCAMLMGLQFLLVTMDIIPLKGTWIVMLVRQAMLAHSAHWMLRSSASLEHSAQETRLHAPLVPLAAIVPPQ
jgi:hypothetical protein